MGNAIFDIMPDGPIDPFIGAGAGAVHAKLRERGNLVGFGVAPSAQPAELSAA